MVLAEPQSEVEYKASTLPTLTHTPSTLTHHSIDPDAPFHTSDSEQAFNSIAVNKGCFVCVLICEPTYLFIAAF